MAKKTGDLEAAKAAAVKAFLPTKAPQAEFAALSATAVPRNNVVGIGIGKKVKNGKDTKSAAIRFYVERKLPKTAIAKADMLPSKIDGVPTDVIETGRFFAQVPIAQRRLRPAKGGCSVGFQVPGFVMAGTFGCLVTDGTTRFILSNNHVLADENALPLKSPIFQPGLLDNGVAPGDRIAELSKFVKLRKLPVDNKVDCAIAALDTNKIATATILAKVGKLASTAAVAAAEKMRVHKHGRTTGYTRGRIVDIDADINVTYDIGTVRFVGQMLIVGDAGQFSDSGDSGSLIVDRATNQATGLLFAGSSTHTIANHIGDVLTALGVTLVV